MVMTSVLISLVLHLPFLLLICPARCFSKSLCGCICSKFNYSFLQLDQTDLFDIKNTVFTKPVNLVQQQCMVRRRGLKDNERRRERNDS